MGFFYPLFSGVVFLIWVAVAIYLLWLAARLVNAVEAIARKLDTLTLTRHESSGGQAS